LRKIENTRARLDLQDAIADMMHVVRAECCSRGDSTAAFGALWDEIEAAVPRGLVHFEDESGPDSLDDAVEVVLVNNRKASNE
jgi:hypothetical protein